MNDLQPCQSKTDYINCLIRSIYSARTTTAANTYLQELSQVSIEAHGYMVGYAGHLKRVG